MGYLIDIGCFYLFIFLMYLYQINHVSVNVHQAQPLNPVSGIIMCVCACACQVAGRLHVEVWRGTEGSEEEGPEQCDAQQNVTDGDPQERKLDCVVRTCSFIHLCFRCFDI